MFKWHFYCRLEKKEKLRKEREKEKLKKEKEEKDKEIEKETKKEKKRVSLNQSSITEYIQGLYLRIEMTLQAQTQR